MSLRLPATVHRLKWALTKRLAPPSERRHILFRHEGTGLTPQPSVRTISSPEALAEVPRIDALADMEILRRELAHGARLSFVAEDGRVLCYALHARIRNWFVPLGDADEVVYSVVTSRAAMGRGLAPLVSRAIAHEVHEKGGAAWVDCVGWNTRAHRAFEKAGFVRFGDATYPARGNSAAD